MLGGLNLFQLLRINGDPTGIVWLAVVIGGLMFILAVLNTNPPTVQVLGIIVGLLIGGLAALFFVGLLHGVRETHNIVRLEVGPWIALGGCVLMVVGGLMPRVKRPTTD